MEHHRQWAKDLCPDYLTPEAVQCMRENLKIITAKDFLSTSTPKIARTCGFEEEKVEHAKEAIYNLYSVNVLNCGEWFMETKRLNEKKLRCLMQDVFAPFLSCVLEPGHLVEMFGCPGSGKTQFSIFLSVKALSRGKNVIYVDTRNDFSVTRFMEMSKKASGSSALLWEGLRVCRTHSIGDLTYLTSYLQNLDDHFMSNIGLIIIDNISTLVLPWLQDNQLHTAVREVTLISSRLRQLMSKRSLSVFVTNTATTFVDEGQRIFKPSLGKVISNVCDTRIFTENVSEAAADQQVFKLSLHKSTTSPTGQTCYLSLSGETFEIFPKPLIG